MSSACRIPLRKSSRRKMHRGLHLVEREYRHSRSCGTPRRGRLFRFFSGTGPHGTGPCLRRWLGRRCSSAGGRCIAAEIYFRNAASAGPLPPCSRCDLPVRVNISRCSLCARSLDIRADIALETTAMSVSFRAKTMAILFFNSSDKWTFG